MNLIEAFNSLVKEGFEFFGRYYSSYRGWVVDNNDPEGFGRLKLKVPELYGDDVLEYWAWPKGNYSGRGYGLQVIPEKKDMVWVMFEKGNPRKPIWEFGHFGEMEKPQELSSIKKYWFRTPGGLTLLLDDDSNRIQLQVKDGMIFEINKDGISSGKDQSSTYKAVKGDTAKAEWEKEKDRVSAIVDALVNSATATDYSGSTYKANIAIALAPYQVPTAIPDYTQSLSNKNTLE